MPPKPSSTTLWAQPARIPLTGPGPWPASTSALCGAGGVTSSRCQAFLPPPLHIPAAHSALTSPLPSSPTRPLPTRPLLGGQNASHTKVPITPKTAPLQLSALGERHIILSGTEAMSIWLPLSHPALQPCFPHSSNNRSKLLELQLSPLPRGKELCSGVAPDQTKLTHQSEHTDTDLSQTNSYASLRTQCRRPNPPNTRASW